MLELITGTISDHWVPAIYFGTMLLNENAILLAFSLSVGSGTAKYAAVALISWAAVLTNDVILFAVAKYGLSRFYKKEEGSEDKAKTLFDKIFLRNVFLSFLLIKFVFGARIMLTLHIVSKKRIMFRKYLIYNFFGTALYVSVLGIIGWLIGNGIQKALGSYHFIARAMASVTLAIILAHLCQFMIPKIRKWRNRPVALQ